MKLYIIGNGFDIHHGLRTNYKYYREFLQNIDCSVAYAYERICEYSPDYSEQWNNIESALSIDYNQITDEVISENYPDMQSDKDTYADAEIEMSNYTDFISDFTGRYFVQWLFLVTKFMPFVTKRISNLDTNSVFVNFNYTDTLECLYSIEKDKILHIHGDLFNLLPFYDLISDNLTQNKICINNTIRQEIQFGSAELIPSEVKSTLERQYENDDFYGASLSHAVDKMFEFSQNDSKNVTKNFLALNSFLTGKDITEIVIMGHSLCDADMPYYENILVPFYKDLKWTFYYRFDNDLLKIKQFIAKNNLREYQITYW